MKTSDPAEIETSAQLAAALKELRGSRSLRDLEAAAKTLTGSAGQTLVLPSSTVSDVLNAKSVPSAETLIAFLQVCGIVDEPTQSIWLEARGRVENRHQRYPAGAVRVRDVRARLLGVHAAIQTVPVAHSGLRATRRVHGELPLYVPRDLDADLRTRISDAGKRGGFVLLVGGSSAGKTRALYEAVREVLPTWWLFHPGDPGAIRQVAGEPTPRTVVWLDEP